MHAALLRFVRETNLPLCRGMPLALGIIKPVPSQKRKCHFEKVQQTDAVILKNYGLYYLQVV